MFPRYPWRAWSKVDSSLFNPFIALYVLSSSLRCCHSAHPSMIHPFEFHECQCFATKTNCLCNDFPPPVGFIFTTVTMTLVCLCHVRWRLSHPPLVNASWNVTALRVSAITEALTPYRCSAKDFWFAAHHIQDSYLNTVKRLEYSNQSEHNSHAVRMKLLSSKFYFWSIVVEFHLFEIRPLYLEFIDDDVSRKTSLNHLISHNPENQLLVKSIRLFNTYDCR